MEHKTSRRFLAVADAYIKYLEAGGEISFDDMSTGLLAKHLNENLPVLCGLCATYLYDCAREVFENGQAHFDDIKGELTGHFVVAYHINSSGFLQIADPYHANPLASNKYYEVPVQKFINAVHLGIVSYDANILIIKNEKNLNS